MKNIPDAIRGLLYIKFDWSDFAPEFPGKVEPTHQDDEYVVFGYGSREPWCRVHILDVNPFKILVQNLMSLEKRIYEQ